MSEDKDMSASLTAIPDAEARALLQAWIDTHQARSAGAITACYAADASVADLAPLLVRRGVDVGAVATWLAGWGGPVRLTLRTLYSSVTGPLAVICGPKNTCMCMASGEETVWWSRITLVLRRRDDQWRIVHEHDSMPFYMDARARAALDLTPNQDAA
jgi:ketosteroid isomerase-like protein